MSLRPNTYPHMGLFCNKRCQKRKERRMELRFETRNNRIDSKENYRINAVQNGIDPNAAWAGAVGRVGEAAAGAFGKNPITMAGGVSSMVNGQGYIPPSQADGSLLTLGGIALLAFLLMKR